MVNIKYFRKSNIALALLTLTAIFYYYRLCESIALLEYLNLKYFNNQNESDAFFVIQLINETSQNRFCYFTVSDSYFDIYESKYLLYTYFPRFDRIILQQVVLLFLIFKILLNKISVNEIKKIINIKFFSVYLVGVYFSQFLINNTTNYFEDISMFRIFVVFSFFKCIIAFLCIDNRQSSFVILALICFPFISTGLGLPWFYDFVIFYIIFLVLKNKSYYLSNKSFLAVVVLIIFSLINPILNSPSLEQSIIERSIYVEQEEIDSLVSSQDTYLERKDLESIIEIQNEYSDEELKIEVYDLSRNLKDVTYPHRWKFMVSHLPDAKFHFPALVWLLSLIVLLFDIFNIIKNEKKDELKKTIQKISNILIFYQLFSLFFGLNIFFNSFSNLFFLNRNSELLTLGEIQTWRGITDHYEIFSNFQVFCLCFYLINFYYSKSNKNFIFILFSLLTTVLSQSRWSVLVIFFILLILLLSNLYTNKLSLTFPILFLILLVQFVPVFDRGDPFFEIHPTKDYQNVGVEGTDELQEVVEAVEYGFEFITDPLNRTAPWTMFYKGYKPTTTSFLFGHGPGAYLNIVKNSDSSITSGPHSSVLQILNRFGILTILILLYFLYSFIRKITLRESRSRSFLLITITILMLSFELKTDTLMLMDGVYIFGFNLVIINLLENMLSNKSSIEDF